MSTPTIISLPRCADLDPITLYVHDLRNGSCTIVVTCWMAAWTCYWGNIGRDGKPGAPLRFMAAQHPDYIAGCLLRGRGQFITSKAARERELQYLTRVCAAIVLHLKSLAGDSVSVKETP